MGIYSRQKYGQGQIQGKSCSIRGMFIRRKCINKKGRHFLPNLTFSLKLLESERKKIIIMFVPFTSKPPRNRSHPFKRIFSPSMPKNSSKFSLPISMCDKRTYVMSQILIHHPSARLVKIKPEHKLTTFVVSRRGTNHSP